MALHIRICAGASAYETLIVNHVLFHAIFLSVHHIAPSVPHTDVALLAILLVMLPVPLMVFALLRKAAGDSLSITVLIALSLALTIVASITIWSNRFMLGYINPIVYHNPTSITARLFVIPLSLLALRIFQGQAYRNLNQRVYIALLSATLLSSAYWPSLATPLHCCLVAASSRYGGFSDGSASTGSYCSAGFAFPAAC